MAYEVTANRRRPQLFRDLAGQEFVVSTLTSAIDSKRIAHAYLFSGPRGVGKTSSARILAKSLNCKDGPTASPCGVCNNCKEITTGSSMDVIEIDGASNTSVNDIREIKDEVLFSPTSSRYKIYIIDEVHMLSNSAFNALLKTIEEPPEYIIFIFATTEIHKVPATIRSRCQQFNFKLIPTDTLKDLLVDACNEMKISYTDDSIYWIAKEGNGSSRDAYTLFDQVVSFSNGDITLEKIKEKLGLVGLDNINELVESMALKDSSAVISKCDYILQNGVSVEQFIVDLAEYFRNLLFIKYGINKESLLGYSAERVSTKAVDSFTVVQLEHGVELILNLYKDIRYSVNPRFELELLLSRLSTLTDYISNSEILEKIKLLKESIAGGSFNSEPIAKKKILNNEIKEKTTENKVENSSAAAFFNKFKKNSSTNSGTTIENKVEKSSSTIKKENTEKNESIISSDKPKVDTYSSFKENVEVDNTEHFNTNEPIESNESSAPVSIESLKKSLFRKLRTSSITLASILSKADKWEKKGNKIVLFYSNPFELSMVEKEKNKVLTVISEIDPTITNVIVKKSSSGNEEDEDQEVDEHIEKILSMFRGTII